MGKRILKFLGILAIAVAVFFLAIPVYLVCDYFWMDEQTIDLVLELTQAVAALLALVVLGHGKMLRPSGKDFKYVFGRGWWILAISLAIMVLELTSYLGDGDVLAADWPSAIAYLGAYCAGIGFFEEGLFRGIVLIALLALIAPVENRPRGEIAYRHTAGTVVAMVLAAMAFGAAHIDWGSLDYSDPLQIAQALLKVGQTGVYGFFLSVAVLRNGSIVGASLYHGLDDFLVMLVSTALFGATETEYVSSGEDAWATIVLYSVTIVLYLPVVILSARDLAKMLAEPEPVYAADPLAQAAPVAPEGVSQAVAVPQPVVQPTVAQPVVQPVAPVEAQPVVQPAPVAPVAQKGSGPVPPAGFEQFVHYNKEGGNGGF